MNLSEEEKNGGHTIAEHVGRSSADLTEYIESTRQEIPTDGGTITSMRKSEGSFNSLEAANDFANQVLQKHKDEVDLVASGEWDEQWLEDRFGYPTGVEAIADRTLNVVVRRTFNVGVLIVHDSRSTRGYRIKTAYPKNDKSSYPFQ